AAEGASILTATRLGLAVGVGVFLWPRPLADSSCNAPTACGKNPRLGRIYVTYQKYNTRTGLYYSGRTSMVIDLTKPLRPQAALAVANREANHHIDEDDEPGQPGFQRATLDRYAVGTAVDYGDRSRDLAYSAIRGREQQLIDFRGGSQSDVSPPRTENRFRAVRKGNEKGLLYHLTANYLFGQLHPY